MKTSDYHHHPAPTSDDPVSCCSDPLLLMWLLCLFVEVKHLENVTFLSYSKVSLILVIGNTSNYSNSMRAGSICFDLKR